MDQRASISVWQHSSPKLTAQNFSLTNTSSPLPAAETLGSEEITVIQVRKYASHTHALTLTCTHIHTQSSKIAKPSAAAMGHAYPVDHYSGAMSQHKQILLG